MGPSGPASVRGPPTLYHGKYEKSARSPSLIRTVFLKPATKRDGGASWTGPLVNQSAAAKPKRGTLRLALRWHMRPFVIPVPSALSLSLFRARHDLHLRGLPPRHSCQ